MNRFTFCLAPCLVIALASCGDPPRGSDNNAALPPSDNALEPETNVANAGDDTDALVPGTDYNATADIACGFAGAPPNATCPAGVKRHWGEDGTNLVEVTKPDGTKRAIFFHGTTPYSADSAEADGSAGWDFKVTRTDDRNTIVFGPETYVIVDALVEGG